MSKKILIIEDDIDISEVLKLQLELKEYEPVVASSYLEAQRFIKEPGIDLFLIDRMLPDASGLDICKYLRRTPPYNESPIIMITAMGEPENIVEGLAAGACYHFSSITPKEVSEFLKTKGINTRNYL